VELAALLFRQHQDRDSIGKDHQWEHTQVKVGEAPKVQADLRLQVFVEMDRLFQRTPEKEEEEEPPGRGRVVLRTRWDL
jgi:hypothetical protein